MKFGLSPQLGSVFALLMANEMVTVADISALGVARPYTTMKRLRALVEPDVMINARYSLGYWIDPVVKEKVLADRAAWESGEQKI